MLNVVYWVRGPDFAAMTVKSAESIHRCYPGARVFVYADEPHKVLKNPVFHDVLMVPAFNNSPAMVANLQAQVHFCLTPYFTAPTMFLDADVLAVERNDLWERDSYWKDRDMIVTQRDHIGLDDNGQKIVGVARNMPYNYGVLVVNNTEGGKEAMIWLRQRVSKYGHTYQKWYGNQWALRELVGGACVDPVPRQVVRSIGFWNVRIQVLDGEKFNYTPESETEDFTGRYFVHVKGDRKDMFNPIAERLAS